MHELELRFIEVAKRHALVGMQAAKALNDEQDKLQLELVLTPERLASPEGTAQSRATLEQLREFMHIHKAAFEQMALACSTELAGTLAEVPVHLQEEYRAGIVTSINWQLEAQSLLYRNRERWIAAALEICQLIDTCRDAVVFAEEGMGFVNDDDLERFQALFAVIEEIHQLEVAQLSERSQRLVQSLAVLEQVVPA
ncbi:hypothetical protein SAMN05216229_1295 [Geopseudomonas sagittaria]|uniref:Uncharacterized protein n=1 Tax=Geopseudomonas sagittaria TaxID=1135990 RepID=A0A1I5Z5W2_9GAMM|nr:hypothetical protein [Pseudomonas sagittaria]SFQ51854.1 hypothetical protein SAMN05216229_1295 [Pseudomonas sagittaria]